MSKGLEALDKLEECAYAMKDLPMSNWIDLANSEAELDLKIMDWVETIKFEIFKGKQALQRLEAIDNSNPSEALKYVNGKIADLEDDLQHYTMVEKDKCKEFFIREDLKKFTTIEQTLLKVQKQEKALEIIKKHFIIKLEEETDLNGNVWGRLVSIQSKEDEGTWDTAACANIVNCKEDFDLLKEVFDDE